MAMKSVEYAEYLVLMATLAFVSTRDLSGAGFSGQPSPDFAVPYPLVRGGKEEY